MTTTWQIIVHGVVQGVGYRASCVVAARRIGVSGWVRNRRDGTVEAIAQGSADQLLAFCEWMRQGPPGAQVTSCEVDKAWVAEMADAPLKGFEQRASV
ncbi:acylphosphatase [Pandoraea pneumonica]|jgi:acylphosphatase|uniref:acylphosphatase n=1 Tax=Pandoraea pneumonica TaxID=2508299 RepID=A0A5E4RUZ7_9BURK|nr:acylphosphatase [Pandoraea pneumonica]VVD66855.1 acylphosphatase [Pandoraea pneumonica]